MAVAPPLGLGRSPYCTKRLRNPHAIMEIEATFYLSQILGQVVSTSGKDLASTKHEFYQTNLFYPLAAQDCAKVPSLDR